ncbi:MAG TPA: NUDIX hydrolase [Patescibacteria group bacterium]|nr:NUDIX hydrolase [Patescibacteria group bacterium]
MKNKKQRYWKVVRSKQIVTSPHFTLRADTIELPNGTTIGEYTVWQVPDGVVVVAITKDGNVIFTRQYRHGTGEVLLQLPGGSYDKRKENPKEAAARELLEETGYKANKLTYLGEISIYPSKMTKQVCIYLTRDVEQTGTTQFDATEDIEIISYHLPDVVKLIEQGKITDAEVIAAILLAARYLKMV